jgi:nucleosome binding factor SPN SPT16 subunit
MWILKNSKELLESLKWRFSPQIYSIKTYDFTTVCTTIPHDKLKTRFYGMIDNCFFKKNCKRKYSYLVVNQSRTYFVIPDSECTHKYSEVDIKEMLGLLIDNIFEVFGNQIFQQTVGIPMGTNCAPLLVDFFIFRSKTHSKTFTWEE